MIFLGTYIASLIAIKNGINITELGVMLLAAATLDAVYVVAVAIAFGGAS